MEILKLEQNQAELQSFLNEPASNRTKLLRISEFFSLVLSSSNLNLTEVYIASLFSEYLSLLERIKIRGLSLDNLTFILNQFDKLKNLNYLDCYKSEIEEVRIMLQKKFDLLSSWLNGTETDIERGIIYFPVLEKCEPEGGIGFLEIIRVKISNGENKFLIDPYESENDAQLQKQMHLCWGNAIEYCRKYIKKIKPTHTVELKFENRLGVYVGNSLGIALSLAFIEAILKHYNSKTIVNINGCIAVTGGIDHYSKIISTSKTIIEIKVESVFYSDAQIFCVPKTDEIWAEEKLQRLKERYPERNLRIIGLIDLNDLLDRRQIVEIRKQKLVVRSGKFIKNNWISAVATVILAIIFAYLFVMDFDDNPYLLTSDGSTLYIKNHNGKLLWTKALNVTKSEIQINKFKNAKIVDINNDGKNELILCNEIDKNKNKSKNPSLTVCYDSRGNELWHFDFKDKVKSDREELNTEYSANLLDTLTYLGTNSIFIISSNESSFSSAIYRLNLENGERLPGTFWASGHIMDGAIKDIDDNNKPDIVGVGYENGYEDFVFFAFEMDTLTKVRPTTEQYLIRNFPVSEMKSYIRFPKTDFDNYFEHRTPGYVINSFADDGNNKKFIFSTSFPKTVDDPAIGYEINYDLKNINVVIDSDFKVKRDTLVTHDKLDLPYTDTGEYKDIIKSKTLYWKNGNWVKRKDLD